MTLLVADVTPRIQYTASGGQTVFTVPFEFRSDSDLKVYVNDSLKTLTTQYTVTGAGVSGGGSVTFLSGLLANDVVVIYRDMPIARTSEQFVTGGQLPGETLEVSLDDVTMKMQQVERDVERSLRLAPYDSASAGDFLLPVSSVRANKFLQFNGSGVPTLVDFVTLEFANGTWVTTVGGTADAITLTPSPAITSYVSGQVFRFVSTGANTGAVTVNVSGLGVKNVTKNGATALAAGDIANGAIVTITYDGTRFQMVVTIIPLTIRVDQIELGHASDTSLTRSAAGIPAAEGVPLITQTTGDARYLKQGRTTIPIAAGSMQPATTNGAAEANVESTTNRVLYRTLDFDQTTQEFAGFTIPMPKNWNNGTLTFQPIWTAAAGTGTVDWALQAVALSNDDAIDVAYGTEQVSGDTLIATGDIHIGPESAAITVGGTPADDDLIAFRIKRNVSTDNLTADARLIGIRLYFTTNAPDDT